VKVSCDGEIRNLGSGRYTAGMSTDEIQCPGCGADVPADATQCPDCGASTVAAQIGATTASECPSCHAHLTSVAIGNATIEECIPCAGIWVKAADFDAICADEQSETAAMNLPMREMPAEDEDAPVHYLKCPTCGQIMNRTVYGQVSGVVVSTCRDHGIWFDHGGLRRVIELVRSGALQKAQARQAEESQREEALAAQDAFLDSLPGVETTYWKPRTHYRNADVIGAIGALIRYAVHI